MLVGIKPCQEGAQHNLTQLLSLLLMKVLQLASSPVLPQLDCQQCRLLHVGTTVGGIICNDPAISQQLHPCHGCWTCSLARLPTLPPRSVKLGSWPMACVCGMVGPCIHSGLLRAPSCLSPCSHFGSRGLKCGPVTWMTNRIPFKVSLSKSRRLVLLQACPIEGAVGPQSNYAAINTCRDLTLLLQAATPGRCKGAVRFLCRGNTLGSYTATPWRNLSQWDIRWPATCPACSGDSSRLAGSSPSWCPTE